MSILSCPSASLCLPEHFSCLSLNFQLFVCSLFNNSSSITGILWLSARYLAKQQRVTSIAMLAICAALCSRCDNNGEKKFIAVTMGYQSVTAQRWLWAEASWIFLSCPFYLCPLVPFCSSVRVKEDLANTLPLTLFGCFFFCGVFGLFHLSCVVIPITVAKHNNLLGDLLLSHTVNHLTF